MIHLIGGGTFSHVRNHLALAAPAFGGTVRQLQRELESLRVPSDQIALHLTKMAEPTSHLVTNGDVGKLLNRILDDKDTRVIVLNAALCDFDGQIGQTPSGSHADRLHSRDAIQDMRLTPADKLIGRIYDIRPDVEVVGFKTTTHVRPIDQGVIAHGMLSRDRLAYVFANDTITRYNLLVDRNGTVVGSHDRDVAVKALARRIARPYQ